MKKQSTRNIILIILFSLAVVFSMAAFYFYWDITKSIIRLILESKITVALLWVITVLIFLFHYFIHKNKDVIKETIITKQFGTFVDSALGGIGHATAITTAITLIKGIFIQKFFKDKIYFAEFEDLDLMTISGVTLFLLYLSVMKAIEIAKEAHKAWHTSQVMTEDKIVVIPDKSVDNSEAK